MTKIIAIIVVVLVIAGGWYLWSSRGASVGTSLGGGDSLTAIEADISGLSVEEIGKDIEGL